MVGCDLTQNTFTSCHLSEVSDARLFTGNWLCVACNLASCLQQCLVCDGFYASPEIYMGG